MRKNKNQSKKKQKNKSIQNEQNTILEQLKKLIEEGNEEEALKFIEGKQGAWKEQINRFFLIACEQETPKEAIIQVILP